jgi:two-component system chemotaxis sensor kinase CheA
MNAGGFFADEFIDDFLQEAEEHLQTIFDGLLALESSQQIAAGEERALQQENLITPLLRSYHTLKGLSGMIGLDAAAQISHGLESVLKDVQRALIPLDKPVIDGLLQGSRALQDWVETLRNPEHPAPPPDEILQALHNLQQQAADDGDLLADMPFPEAEAEPQDAPDSDSASAAETPEADEIPVPLPDFLAQSLKPGQENLIQQASARGERLYHIIFTPSKEKAAAGITVNQIRAQLEAAGQIILAVPEISGTNVRFHFLLAAPASLSASDFPEVALKAIQPGKRREKTEKPRLQVVHNDDDLIGLRIRLGDLNNAMHLVGSLVVTYARMAEHIRELPNGAQRKRLQADLDALSRTLRDLRENILHMRMVPVANLFARVPLLVRQTCQQTGKQATLNIIGQNTLLDKVLAEKLADPLLHLVRNAITPTGLNFPKSAAPPEKRPLARSPCGPKPVETTFSSTFPMMEPVSTWKKSARKRSKRGCCRPKHKKSTPMKPCG